MGKYERFPMIEEMWGIIHRLEFAGEEYLCLYCKGQNPKIWEHHTKNVFGDTVIPRHNKGHKPDCHLAVTLQHYKDLMDFL
jgi:hypothetical protein